MSSCNCPSPPGGQVTCPPGHMAVCIVKNGVPHAACYPPSGTSAREIQNWALTILTGIARSPNLQIRNDELEILRSGAFERSDGSIAYFHLPNVTRGRPEPEVGAASG